jgi:hypothetical protein|tara:strand:+ start:1054 stop:1980 length:927 start_codon:yes stop_codon:yes gene_type:complete
MPCKINNPSNIDLNNLEPHLNGMYDHFESKYGFKKPPVIVFDTDPDNQPNVLGKTAYYDPQSLEIHIFVDGRHPKDILRSIAHELIHHRQNMESRLDTGGYTGPGYYLENDELKEVEHEAMLEGNATMREYEDTVKYTENKNMSLKEWKNNELNGLLMKKFGILKEEKKNMVKDPKTGKMVPNYAIDNKGANDLAEEEEELEEGRNNPRTTNSDKFVGHEDRYLADRIHEGEEDSEEVVEEGELPDALKKYQKNNKKMKPEKDTDDDKPPKGAPPAAAEEDTKQKTLQEAIKRIARAKKVFLKGKRIK